MYKFIFEDKATTPSSVLLKSSYNGSSISFSNGDNPTNVLREIEKCLSVNKDCEIIVFYDLPPNYEKVCKSYEKLTDIIFENSYKNVHIIPIICIEYYILSFLVQNNYLKVSDKNTDLVNNLILSFDFNNESVNHFINSNSYRQESLEHVYKELLSYLTVNSLCMSNHTQQSKNSYIGCFYSKNCDCDLKYCKSKCRAELSEKAERFYVELPVFDVIDLNHENLLKSLDIHTEDLNFKKIYDNIYKFYDNLCEKMGVVLPIIARYE